MNAPSYLKHAAPLMARQPTSASQIGTLLQRKELLLKRRRPLTSICEIVLPCVANIEADA